MLFPSVQTFAMLSLLGLPTALAHGFETPEETAFRLDHVAKSKRSLDTCAHKLMTESALQRRFSKRDAFIEEHLQASGLAASTRILPRDFIVGGSNTSCILTPEGEQGPYCLSNTNAFLEELLLNENADINGSLIRKNIREAQAGIPLLLDIQVTNVLTCEPMTNVMLDFWNANATGVYSDYEPEGTLGLTYLRGLQPTDANGLVQVITTFPGFYAGRAQHVHVMAHVNYTTLSNNTIKGGSVVHTGQMFFDQSTLTAVNKLSPYTKDTNTFTLNTADRVIQQQQNTSYYDAFVETRSLHYELKSGVIGFINIAINPKVIPAAAGGSPGGK